MSDTALDVAARRALVLGLASVVTLEEAVAVLPGRGTSDEKAAWVRERLKPSRDVFGVAVYRTVDLAAALGVVDEPPAGTTVWISTAEAARRLGVDRSTLDIMRDRAPALPGGPVRVGAGRARRAWRWNAARLDEWFDAYERWYRQRGRSRGVR